MKVASTTSETSEIFVQNSALLRTAKKLRYCVKPSIFQASGKGIEIED